MPSGTLTLYDNTLNLLLSGTLPSLENSPITALLLTPGYTPDPTAHSVFSDIETYELTTKDATRVGIAGAYIASAAFHSDDLIFGDPVTIGPARYLAFVAGMPAALTSMSLLLGTADLTPAGGALEAQRGHFSVSAPAAGWFSLKRAA